MWHDRTFLFQSAVRDREEKYEGMSDPRIQQMAQDICRQKGIAITAVIASMIRGAAGESQCKASEAVDPERDSSSLILLLLCAFVIGMGVGAYLFWRCCRPRPAERLRTRTRMTQSQTSYTKTKNRVERRFLPLADGDHGAWTD